MIFTLRASGLRAAALAAGLSLGLISTAAIGAQSLHRAPVPAGTERVEVFVRLSTPAVAELNAQSIAASGQMASSEAQRAQAAKVGAEQAAIRGQLTGLGAQELSALRVGANGLRIRVPANQIANLRALPGVRSVGRVEIHRINNIESVPWIGALRAAQKYGLTGTGVKIAIIDTGIDYLHANFRKDGVPGDYAGNDKSIIEPGTFPTAKVVGGWDFAGATYDASNPANNVPVPDPDPLDGAGHGSHVAGTAAGFGVPGSIGPGVAPDALLYALKVFGDGGGSTDLTSDAIEWAMDPNHDGDMSDHLDVINMSLGSDFGEPDDPSAISSNNAVKVGIIVVASAGNAGDIPYVTGAPAVASDAISAAANTPGGRVYARVNVTAPASVAGFKNNQEGAGPVLVKVVGPISAGVVAADPIKGCTPLTNAAEMAGKIALIERGTCTFLVKYTAAQAAGASAIVVFNDGANAGRVDPIVMGGLDSTITIPGVMISSTDGFAVAAVATTTAASPVTATLDAAPDPTRDDQLASFSSRGPASDDDSSFKPDLAAPGIAIVSTAAGTGTGGVAFQGTSMAAPHVSGAAALLRQQHRHLSPAGIKALLQNSTVDANPSASTDLTRNGVGAIRVDAAAALTSYASPGGISFGRINPRALDTEWKQVTLTNMARGSRTFTGTHVPHNTYPGLNVTCPGSVSVEGHGSQSFSVRLRFNPAVAVAAGAFDNGSISQTEVDGWCVLSDGKDALRIGYVAVVDPASGMLVANALNPSAINIFNRGPAPGFAEGFTLAAADGGSHCDANQAGADSCLIARLGVRRADPNFYFGFTVVEFGVSLNKTYQHISNLVIDLFLDTNKDGVDDVQLEAADWKSLDPTNGTLGTYVTAQFDSTGAGFLDWIVGGWDYNDRVAILPFTDTTSGGLVPASFNYRLVVTNRQGVSDTQTGTIDLANELKPDLNSFAIFRGQSAHINVTGGHGTMLWLFPTNTTHRQDDTVSIHTAHD